MRFAQPFLVVLKENEVDAQRSSVHSLAALQFNSCNAVCTQVAITGFWEARVRCDELLPPVHGGFEGGGGDNTLVRDKSDFVFLGCGRPSKFHGKRGAT